MLAAAVHGAFPSGWPVSVDHDPTMVHDHMFEMENGLAVEDVGGDFFPPLTSKEAYGLFCGPLSPTNPLLEFALCDDDASGDCPLSLEGEGEGEEGGGEGEEGEGDWAATASDKKLTHNAYERSRRRKLKDLYATLRSLLPDTGRQKNLSIPSTVAQVLAYIPQLQGRIAKLTRRKEEILSSAARQQKGNGFGAVLNNTGGASAGSYPVVSASHVGDREVMVQICYLTGAASPGGTVCRILGCVESEGFRLLNASTSRIDDDRMSCRLHLQLRNGRCREHSEVTNEVENLVKRVLGAQF